jgi:hypothetical protein
VTIRLTADELAFLLGKQIRFVRALLDDLERAGVATRDGGNFYKLGEEAEGRIGAALRGWRPR